LQLKGKKGLDRRLPPFVPFLNVLCKLLQQLRL
jgi:hypothetical protein